MILLRLIQVSQGFTFSSCVVACTSILLRLIQVSQGFTFSNCVVACTLILLRLIQVSQGFTFWRYITLHITHNILHLQNTWHITHYIPWYYIVDKILWFSLPSSYQFPLYTLGYISLVKVLWTILTYQNAVCFFYRHRCKQIIQKENMAVPIAFHFFRQHNSNLIIFVF